MIRLSSERAIARLLLDRPEARNAVPLAGWDEIAGRAAEAVDAGARLLILSGAGDAFCAGADLGEFPAIRAERAPARLRAAMRRGIDALAALPVPVLAWIHGPCYGAGVALAMGCDLRIASPAARFAITPAKMGISYPQEDVARLVALTGTGQAARLLFTGAAIDAAEAERIGLIDLVGDEALVETMAEAILANGADSIAALKRGIVLAGAGAVSDPEQDRRFDALIRSDEFGRRLEAVRRK